MPKNKNNCGKRIKVSLEMSQYMALNLSTFLYGAASGRNSDEHHVSDKGPGKRLRTEFKKIALKIQNQAQ